MTTLKIKFALIAIVIFSCTYKTKLTNKTFVNNTTYGVLHKLIFENDTTYKYIWQNGLNAGIDSGKYVKTGKQWTLQSYNPKNIEILVFTSFQNSKDSIYFEVKSMNNIPLASAIITFQQGNFNFTDTTGKLVIINDTSLTSFTIKYLNKTYKVDFLNTNNYNHIICKINTEVSVNYNLNGAVIKKRGNKIIMFGNALSNNLPIGLIQTRN